MSRTRRDNNKLGEVLRFATPYRRQQRRKILKEFEKEYIGRNQSPVLEM